VHTLLEAHLLERAVQLGVPGPRRLPQPVQGLAQPENLALLPEDDEAEGLPHIHLLLEVAVEESGLDIQVMDTSPLLGSEREENADGLNASHGRECVIIVDPLLLDETACDEPRIVLDHLPGLILLELEHPLQSDRAVASRQVDELPHTVVLYGVDLLLHRGVLGPVTLGFSEGAGFPSVRQVKFGIDVALRTPWHHCLVTEDSVDGAVVQRGVIVHGINAVLVTLQG
jgi:hypothetical protein